MYHLFKFKSLQPVRPRPATGVSAGAVFGGNAVRPTESGPRILQPAACSYYATRCLLVLRVTRPVACADSAAHTRIAPPALVPHGFLKRIPGRLFRGPPGRKEIVVRNRSVASSLRTTEPVFYLMSCKFTFRSVKENVLPAPGSLRTVIRSPCASTMCLTIANPRPVPPCSRERPLSVR